MTRRSILRGALVSVALIGATPTVAQTVPGGYSNLIVFGDSLVDAGNISVLTGGRTPNENFGYFDGRFTNGFNYPDLLSLALYGTPTVASLSGGSNFAFGGARVVNHGDTVPDINAQLALYTARIQPAGGVADPNALYILNFGGNDVFGLNSGAIGSFTPSDYASAVVATYSNGVRYLDSIGARNILITGIPNFGDPVAQTLDAQLQTSLDGIMLSGTTTLFRFSYLDFFQRLQANPGAFGLPPLDFTKRCITDPAAVANGCQGIFSFDGTHPTAAVQGALARDIDRQFAVTAVPEPTTWAMMLFGFLAVGMSLRRRRAPAFA